MSQQVIMAVARVDADGTLMRPDISVHDSIAHAQTHFWENILLPLSLLLEDKDKIESRDDHRIMEQVNVTGTTTIDVDFNPGQVCATIKVII